MTYVLLIIDAVLIVYCKKRLKRVAITSLPLPYLLLLKYSLIIVKKLASATAELQLSPLCIAKIVATVVIKVSLRIAKRVPAASSCQTYYRCCTHYVSQITGFNELQLLPLTYLLLLYRCHTCHILQRSQMPSLSYQKCWQRKMRTSR